MDLVDPPLAAPLHKLIAQKQHRINLRGQKMNYNNQIAKLKLVFHEMSFFRNNFLGIHFVQYFIEH